MKVAAVQMTAALGDVDANLAAARRLAARAFEDGARWVILPEFFTSAMGYHRAMRSVAEPFPGRAGRLLSDMAREFDGPVGGSSLFCRQKDVFNTFVLAFPDGRVFTHDKDRPTMWENAYYKGGTDDGICDTPAGRVGVALCWEFVRTDTVRRLLGRVDFVVGGSCWWTLPRQRIPGFPRQLAGENLTVMKQTPSTFARLVGVPVVHAAHAGPFSGSLPLFPGLGYDSHYLGETQIVDRDGTVLARMAREDGEGYVVADIDPAPAPGPSLDLPDRFWIPDLAGPLRFAWHYQNAHGRAVYRLRRLLGRLARSCRGGPV